MRRPRTTTLAALVFLAAAAVFVVWHAKTNYFGAWTPNLGASCVEIAATILVVDTIVRHEANRRLDPLRDSAHQALGRALRRLLDTLEYDIGLAQAKSFDEIAPDSNDEPLEVAIEAASVFVRTRAAAATEQIEEVRLEYLAETIAREMPIIDRRLSVDRDLLAPSLTATLEDVIEALVRPAGRIGGTRIQIYRLDDRIVAALQMLAATAENDPDVRAFVETYINEPRRTRPKNLGEVLSQQSTQL